MSTITPHVSFIMPCYNEEECISYTIPRLCREFENAGLRLELVACDNGSTDRTGEIIRQFHADGYPVVANRVEVNEGYGNGVLQSLKVCTAPWIGIIPADGQVDAEDVVRLYESVSNATRPVVGKVHRRFRLDGPMRAVISFFYNAFMLALWPGLGTLDVNGSPKLMRKVDLERMDLQSKDWLLDPELMIKAHMMGLTLLEINVFSRMRESGSSHVQTTTAIEFVKRLIQFKFGGALKSWQQRRVSVND
jgi:glycosyltransferase involved in cell wall biosynthesis